MTKAFQTLEPWFGSFTPADPKAPAPLLTPVEPEAFPIPESMPPVPQTGPGGGISYDGFLYGLMQTMESTVEAMSSGGSFTTSFTSLSNNDLLRYDSGTAHWVNATAASLIGGPYLPLVGGTITGTPGTLIVNAPNAATGAILTAQVNNSRRFLVSADSDHILSLADTSTTGPTATLRLFHKSTSGTPTVGFGSSLQFWGEDDSGSAGSRTAVEYATIRTEASSTTAGAVSSDLVMMNKVSGTSTEGLRFKGSDGRAIFAGALQSPALHVGDLVTHPATAHISRSAGAANPSVLTYLRVKPVNDTAIGTGVDPILVDFDLSSTQQLATGARGHVYAQRIVGTTWSAVGASTLTEATGVFFNSLPVAGTNVTITDRYAAYFNGPVRFDPTSLAYVWKLPADNTALTGGITGRIPINIGGAIRYVPYYTS